MDRRALEAVATDFHYLRGLFAIPLGGLMILAALGNWAVGPFEHTWAFLVCAIGLGAICVPIRRFYDEHYGRVILSIRQQRRAVLVTLLAAPLVYGGSLLLRSRADWSFDLPVNPIAGSLALLLLVTCAVTVGLRAHHVLIFGALLVAGALPVWDGADPSNIGLVLAGVAIAVAGLFDHRLLVSTFGPPRGPHLGDGRVGA